MSELFFFLTAAGGGVGGGAAIGGAGGTARWVAWYLRTMRSNSSWAKAISWAKDNPVGFSKSVFLGNSIMCAPSFGLLFDRAALGCAEGARFRARVRAPEVP